MSDAGLIETRTEDARPDASRRWVGSFGLLYLGQNVAWAAPSQLLIANQIAQWHPGQKETYLAWLMAAGGVASMIATPVAGVISDRTSSRWGRRSPWILAGGLVAAAALATMAAAGGFVALLLGWLVFQVAIAFAINAAQTVPTDRIPARQYGVVSGVMGLTYTLAVVLGTVLGAALPGPAAYLVTAGALVLLSAQFLARFGAGRSTGSDVPPRVGEAVIPPREAADVAAQTGPRVRTDYWWVFVARLVITLGQSIALFYLLYYLRDRIHYADPDAGVLILTVIYAVAVVAIAVVAGRWSDRVGRRKPFVAISSYGVAGAATLMAFAGSFGVVVVAALLLGVSWGVYMAIDQALINQVLPNAAARGRDMGVMNLAVAVPNSAAPVCAALALGHLGGYPGLYLLAAVLAVAGGLLIRFVRSVV